MSSGIWKVFSHLWLLLQNKKKDKGVNVFEESTRKKGREEFSLKVPASSGNGNKKQKKWATWKYSYTKCKLHDDVYVENTRKGDVFEGNVVTLHQTRSLYIHGPLNSIIFYGIKAEKWR